MLPAIASRIATAAVTLLLVTIVVFALLCALPGEPGGPDDTSLSLPPEYHAALRAQYHLDDPWIVRYGLWVRDVVHGDLGTSFTAKQPVKTMLRERLPVSLGLNALALAAMLGVAVPLGILRSVEAARRLGSCRMDRNDGAPRRPRVLGGAPASVAVRVRLGWLPLSGVSTDGARYASPVQAFADAARHLILPAACLASESSPTSPASSARASSRHRGRRRQGGPRPRLSTLRYVSRHGFAQAVVPLLTLAGF
jgi:peptide/nickel transport system permease protein